MWSALPSTWTTTASRTTPETSRWTKRWSPGGPDGYLTDLPVKAMVEAIRAAGVPAEVSLSAGTFVCNHVLYAVRHFLEHHFPGARNGFIHIPWLPEQVLDKPGQPSMGLELSCRGVEAAIRAIAG